MDKKTREDKVRKEVWAGRKRGGARGQPQGGRYDPWFRIPKFDFAFLPNLDFPCRYKGSTTPSVCFVGMGVGMVRGGGGYKNTPPMATIHLVATDRRDDKGLSKPHLILGQLAEQKYHACFSAHRESLHT